jgi:hypothetical protein
MGSVLLVQQAGPANDPAQPDPVLAQAVESPIVAVADLAGEDDAPAPSYVTPPAADGPGGLPQAELANYLVTHYGYASPLVRRSVGAGLISAADDASLDQAKAEDTQVGR